MNCAETRLGGTSAVGCFSLGRNGFGLEEMCGTIWEWTRSLYGQWNAKTREYEHIFKYPYDAADGREDMSRDDTWARVLRGGSWNNVQQNARVAVRSKHTPDFRSSFYGGFRVVCAPVLSPPASECAA
jgi:formylglycine-generating enzyme required for sulfatase activity